VKKIAIIFIGLLLIVLAIMLTKSFSVSINSKSADNSNKALNPSPSNSNSLKAKENNEGTVAIVVTPLNLTNNSIWNFEIALNTHSEELNSDLVIMSELSDDQGKLYKLVSWGGSPLGGHHREGILKFGPISPRPKSLELKIKNIGGVLERRFKWIF